MKPTLFASSILSLAFASTVWANGTITHLSGPVSVTNSGGKSMNAQAGAKVVTGDTIVTGSGAYVRIEMSDGAEMVMRPDSSLRIDNYHYVAGKPAEDKSSLSMLKGGLRTISGMIGKRGSSDAYEMKTPTATIGIRGTQWDVRICDAGSCGALPNGTYLGVRFGSIVASTPLGSSPLMAGQFGVVPPGQTLQVLPRDPGVGFTAPPAIPKLDEKKKVETEQQKAAAASATQTSNGTSAPGQTTTSPTSTSAKPSEQSDSGSSSSGKASTQSGSGTTTNATSSGQSQPASAPTNVDAGSTSAGPVCTLQ